MERSIVPEWLDALPPNDPRAVRSRRDLRLLNRIMGHAAILRRALRERLHEPNASFVEIGAGDGTLLLRALAAGCGGDVVLVDRQAAVRSETMADYRRRARSVSLVIADVFDWLRRETRTYDAIVANLFLHHFEGAALAEMLALVAKRTNLFIACEPRRAALALAASRMLGLLGCSDVTRHDALVSVRAGFRGRELSLLWPAGSTWRLEEAAAGLFSHRFVAWRMPEG